MEVAGHVVESCMTMVVVDIDEARDLPCHAA
jgi:hypothetical protein